MPRSFRRKRATPPTSTYAIALFGAAMTPYEVFFFSSGGVENAGRAPTSARCGRTSSSAFPWAVCCPWRSRPVAATVFLPQGIQVDTLGQIGLPVAIALGKLGMALVLLGFFAPTFGAACETGLSVGYSVSQYFGWQWGKYVEPLKAARFHTMMLLSTVVAVGVLLTTVDPIMLTEYSVVFSAIALPLTYFPILVVANDRTYMGRHANGRLANTLGSIYLVLILVAATAAIPLMIVTKAGQ